ADKLAFLKGACRGVSSLPHMLWILRLSSAFTFPQNGKLSRPPRRNFKYVRAYYVESSRAVNGLRELLRSRVARMATVATAHVGMYSLLSRVHGRSGAWLGIARDDLEIVPIKG